ncbi:MAG: MFS transporter [Bacteriovoracaceae bacterium]|nr:MFS transporter [Bacteroidota bacterium]
MDVIKPISTKSPWSWIPTLYFGQGIPYVVVMTISVIMYKKLGISNTDIAYYTSWLYLPWVIKPLWSPFIDIFKTKRFWIVTLQLIIGASLSLVAFTLPMSAYFQWSLAIFWLMAFSSATHDIAADGFYMLALEQHQQAAFVGVRSTFYRIAMITGQGALVYFAGYLETHSASIASAWSVTFFILSGMFISIAIYHRFILPYPASDHSVVEEASASSVLKEFFRTFGSFFKKKEIVIVLSFLLFYRFAEAQLVKLVTPFLLDPRAEGGLGLTTSDVGIAYGTVGVFCLTLGGLLGGYVISRKGLRFWLWIMVFAIHLPDAMFVYLSYVLPENFLLICAAIGVEQFGYGFGFTAYMLYMVMISDGPYKTAHYAICTGFMALGMMIPGMFSGALQDAIGYQHFFLWVMASTIPGFVVAILVKIDPEFGKKKAV